MRPTRELAQWLAETCYDDLPGPVVHEAKRHVLDTFGTALAGRRLSGPKAVSRAMRSLGAGRDDAVVIGEPVRADMLQAAFINGTSAYALAYDDTYAARGLIHPGNHTVTAALAIGESTHLSGAAYLRAVVLGYETGCRVADAVGEPGGEDLRSGFYQGSTNPHFGSAGAAAAALGLDEEEICNALALAGAQACGIWQRGLFENNAQPFHAGKAASSGVLSALLAQAGLVGGDAVLEGDHGYLAQFSSAPEPERLTAGLGSRFAIEHTTIKLHPAGCSTLPSIDAAIRLHHEDGVRAERVQRVIIETCDHEARYTTRAPANVAAALHSSHFAVARCLEAGHFGLADLTEARVADPATHRLMERIELVVDPEIEAMAPDVYASRVTVVLNNGGVHTAYVGSSLGSPWAPASDEQVVDKFLELAEASVSIHAAKQLVEQVWELEFLADLHGLGELLKLDVSLIGKDGTIG